MSEGKQVTRSSGSIPPIVNPDKMADQGETFESFVRNSLKDLKCVSSELNNIKSSLERIIRDHADLSKSVQFLSEQTSELEKIVKTQVKYET